MKSKVLSLISVSLLCLGACATSKQLSVQVTPDGQHMDFQFSHDAKSLQHYQPTDEALRIRQEILSEKIQSEELMLSISELSLIGQKYDEAANYARSILKRDFKNLDALKTLVKVSLAQKRYDEAVLIADNGLQIQSRDADLLSLKGLAFYFLSDPYTARELWKKAVEVNPLYIPAQMNLAMLYFHNRNLAMAGAAFERVIALHPANADALVGRAVILDLQGKPEEAKQILVGIVKRTSNSPLALYNLALLERDRFKDFESALGHMEAYLQFAEKERSTMEKAIAMREDLRVMLAKQKEEKLTDAQLREMATASTKSGAEVSPAASIEAAPKMEKQTAALPKNKDHGNAANPPKGDDEKSLEDALK